MRDFVSPMTFGRASRHFTKSAPLSSRDISIFERSNWASLEMPNQIGCDLFATVLKFDGLEPKGHFSLRVNRSQYLIL